MSSAAMNETVKYQELILDAIDQLRRRKARPDSERIFNCLYRRKGIGSAESKIALERCVENGIVLRVTYKGNTSYRNAAKKYIRQPRRPVMAAGQLQHHQQHHGKHDGDQRPRRKFTNLLTNAFAELVLEEPDYIDRGIPADRLTDTILLKDSVRYSKRYLAILLQKEVENGGLVQLDNGNYLVGKPPSIAAQNQVVLSLQQNKHKQHAKQMADKQQMAAIDDGDDDDEMDDDDEEEEEEEEEEVEEDDEEVEEEEVHDKSPETVHVSSETTAAKALVALTTAAIDTHTHKVRTGKVGRPLKRTLMEQHEDRRAESQRVGGRRKKAKKVFDPSDCNMPKRRGRPLGSKNLFRMMKEAPVAVSNGGSSSSTATTTAAAASSRPESRTSQNGAKSSSEGGVCCVCHVQNKRGPSEIVSCRECSNKAHATCLNGNNMMLKMYPDNTWRCPHCKPCVVCDETSNAGSMVVCAVCADAYHVRCHKPPLTDKVKPTSKWTCSNCQMPEQLAVDNIQIGCNGDVSKNNNNNTITNTNSNNEDTKTPSLDVSRASSPHFSAPSSPTLPTLSPQMAHNGQHNQHTSSECDSKSDIHSVKDDDIDENIDPSIPDASNWSPDEVCHYFMQYFPVEANVFKEQEIDGHSLLLMKRMDVLQGLSLKLGPALKIYRHVVKLQYRRDDPKLYWP